MAFIIGGCILGILGGSFLGLCFANMFADIPNPCKIIIIIISIISLSIICGLGLESENYNYNNGYCIKCGAEYEAITHKNRTYYECPNCHFGCWY